MARADELTDEQWQLIEKCFPKPEIGQRGRRPRDAREVMNAVLWIMRTGAPWRTLPRRHPPYQTCHRHFEQWLRSGVLQRALNALARHLRENAKSFQTDLPTAIANHRRGPNAALPAGQAHLRDSWQWQTAMALGSPYAARLRTRMKSDSARARADARQAAAAPGQGAEGEAR
jgi:transposase